MVSGRAAARMSQLTEASVGTRSAGSFDAKHGEVRRSRSRFDIGSRLKVPFGPESSDLPPGEQLELHKR
jgi:hypothetical protein